MSLAEAFNAGRLCSDRKAIATVELQLFRSFSKNKL